MVGFEQLRDARPELWQRAADGWRAEAAHAAHCADTIRARGAGPVTQSWIDSVGREAAANLYGLGDAFECAATEMRGVVMVLDGLAESIGIAQSTLRSGIDDAAHSGLHVDAAGRVARPPEALAAPGDDEVIPRVQRMIDEALREATQADEIAARAMARIQHGTEVTNPAGAADVDQNADSRDQMAMLAGDAPPNGNPQLAGQWWQALSQPQRDAYERAEPVVIAGLDGVPDAEREKMHQGEPGIDRARFVAFALDHAYDTSFDLYGGTNCANFVSTDLNQAGMSQRYPDFPGLPDSDWYQLQRTGHPTFDDHLGQSSSWNNAGSLRNYLISNGGESVKRQDVQPGDILFFQARSGDVGHTAIVTGVSPDGDIKYSQHSESGQNLSLDGRDLYHRTRETDTQVTAIRVNSPWWRRR